MKKPPSRSALTPGRMLRVENALQDNRFSMYLKSKVCLRLEDSAVLTNVYSLHGISGELVDEPRYRTLIHVVGRPSVLWCMRAPWGCIELYGDSAVCADVAVGVTPSQ